MTQRSNAVVVGLSAAALLSVLFASSVSTPGPVVRMVSVPAPPVPAVAGAMTGDAPSREFPVMLSPLPTMSMTGRATGPWGRLCEVNELADFQVDFIERYVAAESRKARLNAGRIVPANTFLGTIKVAFHVVYVDFNGIFTVGLLDQTQVQAQIDTMNAAFQNVVQFELASVSYTNNQDWFYHTPGSRQERDMKLSLGADTSKFLNIYSTDLSLIGLLGYATFPWNQRLSPELDGVVIAYDSIPGGLAPYDEGDTAVHEVGHWLGLFHTFQGGCRNRNDGVSDTPAELQPFYGCTLTAPDTCPSQPGLDPINNYMDYSDDACLTEFSSGQYSRMATMLSIFRRKIFQ